MVTSLYVHVNPPFHDGYIVPSGFPNWEKNSSKFRLNVGTADLLSFGIRTIQHHHNVFGLNSIKDTTWVSWGFPARHGGTPK